MRFLKKFIVVCEILIVVMLTAIAVLYIEGHFDKTPAEIQTERVDFVESIIQDDANVVKRCMIEEQCFLYVDTRGDLFIEFQHCIEPMACRDLVPVPGHYVRNRFRNKVGLTSAIIKRVIRVPPTGLVILADGFHELTPIGLLRL